MKFLTVWFLIVLLGFTASIQGEPAYYWEFAGWYGAGCFPNIEFDPNIKGRVYLVSDIAGIWKSDDRGDHWYFINRGLENTIVSQVAVAPSNSNILYAGTKNGLFFSSNAGKTWQVTDRFHGRVFFERPDNYRSIAVSPQDPKTVCIGTAKGDIFYSKDYGERWEDLGFKSKEFPNTSPVTVLVISSDQEFLYAASDIGIFRYSFEHRRWKALMSQVTKVTDFVFSTHFPQTLYAAGEKSLWISEDNGENWRQSALIPQGKSFRIALVPFEGNERIYTIWNKDWNGGMVVSEDKGMSWKNVVKNMVTDVLNNPTRIWANPGGRTTALKIDPFEKNIIFRTDWWGVFRSDDGGKNWQEKIVGAPNSVGSDIIVDGNQIYVATMDNGLIKSSDGGKTYRSLFPVKGYDPSHHGHIWRIALLGNNKILATSSPWGEKVNQIILSEDGGMSFALVRKGLPQARPKKNTMWGEGYPRALTVNPKNPDVIYLGIDGEDGGGLFVSYDGGKSWQPSLGQPPSRRIYRGLAVDPIDPKRIYWGACGQGGGVYRSEDNGKTWSQVLKEVTWIFDLKVDSHGTVYAAGDKQGPVLYVYRNQGRSWSLLKKFGNQGTATAITIDPRDRQRIAISCVLWGGGAPGQIYLTKDEGKTWQDISGDLSGGCNAEAMAFSTDGQYLYISCHAGSVYRLKVP